MSQKQKCRGPEPNTRFGQFSSHRGQTMKSLPPLRWILEEKQQVLDSCFSKCGLDCKPRAPDGSWELSAMQFRASSRLAEFGSASEAGPQEFVSVRAAPLCSSAAFFLSDQPAPSASRPGADGPWIGPSTGGDNGDSNEEKRKKPGLRAWGRPLCPIPVTHYRCIPLGPAWAARVFSGPGSFLFFNITF